MIKLWQKLGGLFFGPLYISQFSAAGQLNKMFACIFWINLYLKWHLESERNFEWSIRCMFCNLYTDSNVRTSCEAIDTAQACCLYMSCRHLVSLVSSPLELLVYIQTVNSPQSTAVQRTIAITSCNQFLSPPPRSVAAAVLRLTIDPEPEWVGVHKTPSRRRGRSACDCFPVDCRRAPAVAARTNWRIVAATAESKRCDALLWFLL